MVKVSSRYNTKSSNKLHFKNSAVCGLKKDKFLVISNLCTIRAGHFIAKNTFDQQVDL